MDRYLHLHTSSLLYEYSKLLVPFVDPSGLSGGVGTWQSRVPRRFPSS